MAIISQAQYRSERDGGWLVQLAVFTGIALNSIAVHWTTVQVANIATLIEQDIARNMNYTIFRCKLLRRMNDPRYGAPPAPKQMAVFDQQTPRARRHGRVG